MQTLPRRDYRDLTIEALGDENRALLSEVDDQRNDLVWCRELLTAAVEKLHAMHVAALERDARYFDLQHQHRALLAERGGLTLQTQSETSSRAA